MKKHSFIFNLILISSTSVALNIVALIFRFYLARLISSEGIGVYQLIMSVYVFAATVATSGLSFTTTRFVSEAIATNREKSVSNILKGIFIFAAAPALISTLLLYFMADISAAYFIGIPETARCLRILSVALPFMSAASCLNGYFVAIRKVAYSSATQIFEDLFQVAVTVVLLIAFKPSSIIEACEYTVAGCALAEIAAAITAAILCKRTDKLNHKGEKFKTSIVTAIAKTTIPLSISTYIKSILSTVENLMIPVSLQKSGMTKQESLSTIGTVKGLAIPLICFPSVFVSAFAKLLLPEIADSRALNNKDRVVNSGNASLSFTLSFSLLLSVVFFLFADDIGLMIYNQEEFFETLRLLSLLIPFMYIDCISDSIMKGLDQQIKVMKYSITEAVIRTIIVWLIIPKTGFSGVIMAMYAGNVVNAVLGIRKLKQIKAITLNFTKKSIQSLLLYSLILYPISFFTQNESLNIILKLFIIIIGVVICVIATFAFNVITVHERKEMKTLMKKE